MDYETITLRDLPAYLETPEFRDSPVLPITRRRAESYIRHPRGEPGDAVLFLARVEGRLLAYLGVFPDRVHLGGEAHRAGWLSCMWVDPACRGKGVAKRFLAMAFEAWHKALLVTRFTPAAKGLYDRTGRFLDLRVAEGLRAYLRLDLQEVLPRKRPALARIRGLIQTAERAANALAEPRLRRWGELRGVEVERVERLDGELDAFLRARHGADLERRGAEDLNWILAWPWIREGPWDEEAGRYHFTAVADRFDAHALALRDEHGDLFGFVHLVLRDGLVTLPHAWWLAGREADVLAVVYREMVRSGSHTLSVFHPELVAAVRRGPHPFLHLRRGWHRIIITDRFGEALRRGPAPVIQDGAGDAAFT